jgi:uncharacterized protein (DUF2267 family)
MSTTGLEVFDKTIQTTHIWLDEMIEDLGTDRHTAWHVLGAVLHALRDRLPLDLSAHLSAELPLLVRGAYFDGWRAAKDALKERSLAEFLERVSDGLAGTKPISSIDAVRSVVAVLERHIAKGQAVKIRNALPEEVRALWPEEVLARHVM